MISTNVKRLKKHFRKNNNYMLNEFLKIIISKFHFPFKPMGNKLNSTKTFKVFSLTIYSIQKYLKNLKINIIIETCFYMKKCHYIFQP